MAGGFFAGRPLTADVEVEESLDALQRALKLGNSNHSYQRLVFVTELVDCAYELGYDATRNHLLPLVDKLASDPEVLVQKQLVEKFGDLAVFLITSDTVENGYQEVVNHLLRPLERLIMEKSNDVRQGAADALIVLASHLRLGDTVRHEARTDAPHTEARKEEIRNEARKRAAQDEVLTKVLYLANNDEDEDAKSTAVQLLNGLAEPLGRDLCQQFIGIHLMALCEDPSFRVRKAVASNFEGVANMVGDQYILERLFPSFEKLVKDTQHWSVRKAAAESLYRLADKLAKESRDKLVPLMKLLLEDKTRWVRNSALQQLGYFIATLDSPDRVPPTLVAQYVEVIEQSKANPDAADIGFHCAYTFGAVTKTMGREHWPELRGAFASLCLDTQRNTRKAIAASLHMIAEALGPELTEAEILKRFEMLVDDCEKDVRNAAVRNVASILRTVQGAKAQHWIATVLQAAINKKDNNWRLRHTVASQLGTICEVLGPAMERLRPGATEGGGGGGGGEVPATELAANAATAAPYVKDTPWAVSLFLQLCGDGVAEVRKEATKWSAKVLSVAVPDLFSKPATSGTGEAMAAAGTVSKSSSSTDAALVRHLMNTATLKKSFRSRMTYIQMCDSIIRAVAAQTPPPIFTDYLLRPLAKLAVDPVRNVRLCWALTMLPHVRSSGRRGQIKLLVVAAARMAKEDKDPEIVKVFENVKFAEFADDDADEVLQSLQSTEGGTGNSSECSDVVGDEEEEMEQPSTPKGQQRRDEPAVSPLSVSSSAPVSGSSGPGAAGAEGAADSPTRTGTEPLAEAIRRRYADQAFLPPNVKMQTPPASPSNPTAPAAAPAFDPVEDALVQQTEVNLDADRYYPERRLLAEPGARVEADAEAEKATPSLAPASAASLAKAAAGAETGTLAFAPSPRATGAAPATHERLETAEAAAEASPGQSEAPAPAASEDAPPASPAAEPAAAPIADPVAEAPAPVEPESPQPSTAPEPAATPAAEAVAEEASAPVAPESPQPSTAPEPAATPVAEAVAEAPAPVSPAVPIAETVAEEVPTPVASADLPADPAEEQAAAAPIAEATAEAPAPIAPAVPPAGPAEEPAAAPIAETVAEEASAPVASEVLPASPAEEPAAAPVAETAAEEASAPVASEVLPASPAEEPAAAPLAETAAEEADNVAATAAEQPLAAEASREAGEGPVDLS